ncbi:cation-translocating P-type ATPase [Fodinicurvata sp. CAU 1616]|uniref:Cation-translocating P-type ATPase n=1 Tax=Aquibaculum arenosum TaxID=3032591 RepID=A0ABT5YI31_9PROT|nr:cation-translocating P-type ATPase [Fodinicurvata sp. CAU 1616]
MRLESRKTDEGQHVVELAVPAMHCGGCIRRIEGALNALHGVVGARVNLTAKRVAVRWEGEDPPPLLETLQDLGYDAHFYSPTEDRKDRVLSELLRALAVAGFAAGNIMFLSVSVWSGADAEARDLFHWISAAIALPVLAYSGRIFFRSAWAALRRGQTNMDVPISIGVLLAFGMSLYDTINHGPHAYFDATVMLLFFLLIGRTLDHVMRERARSAVAGLARLGARGAVVEDEEGGRRYRPVEEIEVGARVLVAAGERVPLDGEILAGTSDLDASLVSGESEPLTVAPGARLQAGTLNLTGPLTLRATATARDSFLAEMIRLMESAEAGRGTYRRIADRASRLYAPVVHSLALLSFFGWMMVAGDWHLAVTIAVAVLIITCPCALGLSVPMVQVVAARRLFDQGIMVKDGGGLERLAEVDTVVFDKTGTLTLGRPRLLERNSLDQEALGIAAALAAYSRHPHSRALLDAAGTQVPGTAFEQVEEQPGYGVEGRSGDAVYRLGLPSWALTNEEDAGEGGTVLSRDGRLLAVYRFEDPLRPGAVEAVSALRRRGLALEILSGDHPAAVENLARRLGITEHRAATRPADKAAHLAALAGSGRKVLMVGDGLNDAPALAAAHVSMAPANAADVGRNAADLVFLRDSLEAVPGALEIAERAGRLVQQNFALSALYNVLALPFAVLGFVTPLIAALAMSLSSILVVANALRLNGSRRRSWRSATSKAHQASPATAPEAAL